MSARVRCPWCGRWEFDPEDALWDREDYPIDGAAATFACPVCGRSFDVVMRLGWNAETVIPEAMERCEECYHWNITWDCCDYIGSDSIAEPLEDCPMEYGGE
mgnify:FL=1